MKKKLKRMIEKLELETRFYYLIFYISLKLRLYTTRSTPLKILGEFIHELQPIKTNYQLIRLGPNGDGGYVVPDDIDNISACFSPGVGPSSIFEEECLKHNMKIFMADASVDGPAHSNKKFNFLKKFITAINDENSTTLEKWIEDSGHKDDPNLLLQMDIEGSEYEVLYSTPTATLKNFRIMIIEFHEMDSFFSLPFYLKFRNLFLKLLESHYCVHIHPNNWSSPVKRGSVAIPPLLEFTFIRKDRVQKMGKVDSLPLSIDYDCVANKSSVILPKCWYKGDSYE